MSSFLPDNMNISFWWMANGKKTPKMTGFAPTDSEPTTMFLT
jgi:hypothetical protein